MKINLKIVKLVAVVFMMALTAVLMMSCGGGKEDGGPPTYTLTYDGNGNTAGTAPIDSNTYEYGETVTVLNNSGNLVKVQDGISLIFCGWNTAANGSGIEYEASDTFSMPNMNLTLYAQWSALRAIGPAGGLIFYDAGSIQSWGRYLEAAPSDQSTGHVWIEGGSTQTTLNGNTSTAIGTGQANSDYIIAQTGHTGSAAKVCLDYIYGIYDDWFLPSYDELLQMYWILQYEGVGGFANEAYWSSSEDDERRAFGVDFANGSSGSIDKSYGEGTIYPYFLFRVRAVRAF